MILRRLLGGALFFLALWPSLALAQGSVLQSGPVTQQHAPKWWQNGIVGDAGSYQANTIGSGISDMPIVNASIPNPACLYDASPATSSGWHSLCLGAGLGGAPQISYNAFGTATPQTLTCMVNGVSYACLPTGGNVAGPNSSNGFGVASFNGATGKVVQDSGIVAQSASPPNSSFTSWLNTNNVQGKNPYGYLGTNGFLVVPNTFGEMAIVGASQSSQVVGGATCCSIGVAAIGLNNNTGTPQGSWVFYGTGSRLSGAGSLVNEFDIFNGGTLITSNAYASPSGQTIGLAVQCGGEPTQAPSSLTGNHCSAGMTIAANGDTFNEGIVFKNAGISGPNTPAIEMAASQSILWTYDSTGPTNYGAQISSLVSSNADSMSEIFTNTGVAWKDHTGNVNFLIANNPGLTIANYLQTMGEPTNNPVILSAQGTDSNINIQLFPKGAQGQVQSTGSFSIGSGAPVVASLEYALSFTKQASASGVAPSAGVLKMEVVAGTSGGTCKIIAYAGTSTTPTTIIDNVGGGC